MNIQEKDLSYHLQEQIFKDNILDSFSNIIHTFSNISQKWFFKN